MPEILDNELLFKVLRQSICARNTKDVLLGSYRKKGVKISTFKEIEKLLRENELVSEKGKKLLKLRGEDKDFSCRACNSGIAPCNKRSYHKLIQELEKCVERRPPPINELDHQPLIPEFTVLRAAAIYETTSLYNKRIICIGDYDMVSVALLSIAKPKKVTVADIDTRLLKTLNDIGTERDWPLECVHHDFVKKLPRRFIDKYDVFVTDPPYAVKGMLTFIRRGIDCLNSGGVGYIAAPFHDNLPWCSEMFCDIQKLLLRKNCITTDIYKNFHEYQKADGLSSSLIRIKKEVRQNNLDRASFYWWKKNKPKSNKPILKVKL